MNEFKVTIPAVGKNGYLQPEYGGNAPEGQLVDGLSPLSPEISWTKVPGAKSYALELIDYDSAGACGLVFVHWTVANISGTRLERNASLTDKAIVQGANSCTDGIYSNGDLSAAQKLQANLANSRYVGPCPPDGDHMYTVRVYALDVPALDLKPGYFIGGLHRAMSGHVVAEAKTDFMYERARRK